MIILYLLSTLNLYANQDLVSLEVSRIDKMRTSMVQAVQGTVDAKTFKAVCAPVGKEAKRVAKEKGWKFRQTSEKFRNPKHKPNSFEKKILIKFSQDPKLKDFWINHNGESHYFRRIQVGTKCLHCHGQKNKRPDFIKKKYPKDRAFGFKQGDFRGLYHVSFPLALQR